VTFDNSVLCDERIGHRIYSLVVIDRQNWWLGEFFGGLVFDPANGQIA
jgi:hypothetical protein